MTDLSKTIIETERLKLVRASMEYRDDIFNYFRGDILEYMFAPAAKNLKEVDDLINKWERQMKAGERVFMAITKKEGGEFLGCTALDFFEDDNPESGAWIKKESHGHGYGTEAVRGLKEWGDKRYNYDHILWPSCAEVNLKSRKLAESLGGTVQKEYIKSNGGGKKFNTVEYWLPRVK